MSRIYDALRRAERASRALGEARRPEAGSRSEQGPPCRTVAVVSNKGGVGKTTIAGNLAVFARALREELPVLVMSLDDQPTLDRMFALDALAPPCTMEHALRARDLASAVQLGQYGVEFVPAMADTASVKRLVGDPNLLRDLLVLSRRKGLAIVDTKSDLEILTDNALVAADRVLVVVKDRASLDQAERVFQRLEKLGRAREDARVVLSMVDRRIKFREGEHEDVLALLLMEVRRRGYPLCESFLSHSPKVESLGTNPEGRMRTVLHGAPKSLVHRQLRVLTEDVLASLAP